MTYRYCDVCCGLSMPDHPESHPPAILAAAIERNAAIDKAAKAFAVERDALVKTYGYGPSFRAAIAEHEQAYDAAKRDAYRIYRLATTDEHGVTP